MLVALVSAAYALVSDAVSFVVSAWCLHRMDVRTLGPRPCRPPRTSLRREIAEAVRVVAGDRYLRYFVVQGGIANFAITGYGTPLVLYAVRDPGLGAAAVGTVLSLGNAGGLVGATVATRATRRWGEARAVVLLQVFAGLAGWLGAKVGVHATVAAMAGLFAVTSLAVLVGPYGRGPHLPPQPMATLSSGSRATARNTTVT